MGMSIGMAIEVYRDGYRAGMGIWSGLGMVVGMEIGTDIGIIIRSGIGISLKVGCKYVNKNTCVPSKFCKNRYFLPYS